MSSKDSRNDFGSSNRSPSINDNKKFRSFKSIENIHKKEVGPYHGFGYLSFISDPINMAKGAEPEEKTMNLQFLIMAVVSKTDISRKIPNYFKFVKKMNLNVRSFLSSQNIFFDLKGPKVKYNLHYR